MGSAADRAVEDRTDATPVEQVAGLGSVLGIWAHPDDDVYLSAGLMALARAAGNDVTVAFATRGQAGGAVGTDTAAVRTREATSALAQLDVPAPRWLGFTDGCCLDVPLARGVAAVTDLLVDVRPATVLTFAADGLTGHPDHQVVSDWVTAAVATSGIDCQLLQAAVTREMREQSRRIDDRFDVFLPGYPRLQPADGLTLHLRLSGEVLDRKVAALVAHHSQTAALVEAVGAAAYRDWVRDEAFVVAQAVASPGRTSPVS